MLLIGLLVSDQSLAQTIYNQATTNAYASSTNVVEKSATASPNDVLTFSNAVAVAYAGNTGGVFNLPSSITAGTTVYRGTYGTANGKRLTITSSVPMQGVGWPPSGSFHPVSYPYGTTSQGNQSAYSLAIGPITDPVTGTELLSEEVSKIGFTILSRTDATYPADIKVTASFSDGTTQPALATVGNPKGSDDTFFGFTAPANEAITNLLLEAFEVGTSNPRSTRIAWDDLVFITSPTGLLPPPQIAAVYPTNGAVHWASNGLHFEARSAAAIEASGIRLVLNSNDVSGQLTITGDPTNRLVSFSGLASNLVYLMEITVSNIAGVASITNVFYTPESPVTLFDSGGFTDDTLYPVGMLQAVTNGGSRWVPAGDPNSALIVDLADGQHGKVLRREQLGADYIEYLLFPPVSSGTVTIELDARVSLADYRLIDLSLNAATANGGGTQGPFIMWGTNALNYYNRVEWVAQTNMDTSWHHLKLTCYVSGPLGNTFDLEVDSTPVNKGLLWRTALPLTVGTLRIGAIRSPLAAGQYGDVDNLVIKVAPEPLVALPVTLLNPVRSNSTFSFSFVSLAGIKYLAQTNNALNSTNWTTLESVTGDGTTKTVTHTNPPAEMLFYRVKSELP